MMRKLLLSALVLGAMTMTATAEPAKQVTAQAGPVELTDNQMDRIVAGAQIVFTGQGQFVATSQGVITADNLALNQNNVLHSNPGREIAIEQSGLLPGFGQFSC